MKKKIVSLALSMLLLASLTACGGAASSSNNNSTPSTTGDSSTTTANAAAFRVGFAVKTQDAPYFVSLVDSVTKTCKAEGWDLTILDAGGDTTKEAENMETFVAQKMDLIFIDSIDPEACVPSINAAADEGIPVIALDSGVGEDAKVVTTVYSDNKQNGRLVGLEYAAKMADEDIVAIVLSGAKGNVAGHERRTGVFTGIIEGKTGLSEADAWEAALKFDDELQAKGKASYPDAGFTVVGQGWASWTEEEGLAQAEDLITANKDITTIIGENDNMLFGSMTALDNAGIEGVDIVAAADGAKEAYERIQAGTYFATGENSPAKIAILGVEVAKEVLVDKKDISSFPAITMTTPNAVTKENVEEFYNPDSAF